MNQLLQNPETTVGELAGKDYRNAEVFRKFGIDFCCGGRQTLEQASRKAGIPEDELRTALARVEPGNPIPEQDFQKWGVGHLAEYIVQRHHGYVRESAPVLLEFAAKVANRHGGAHPELVELEKSVRQSVLDLLDHMEKEERVLFPAIQRLPAAAGEAPADNLQFVRHAIGQMQHEHGLSGEDLRQWRTLSNNYTLPPGACNSYRFLFGKLYEFDLDLEQHIHLENNILFPNALALLDQPGSGGFAACKIS